MARGDLIKKLLLSYQRGEDKKFREIAMDIIREERKKNHHALADQLQKIIDSQSFSPDKFSRLSHMVTVPKDENEVPLIEIRKSKKYLSDVILSEENKNAIDEIIQEFWRSELLKSYNLRPKSKILFCGPPGCGKSLCAEAIAGELGLPIIYNRFDSIISSYLGDTSSDIRKVFDFGSKETWVMLFDEFDAIGKSRNDPNEHGELKRVVNSFLQIMDSFEGQSLIIACTNHESLLDKAIWRRFDEVIYFDKPMHEEIVLLVKKKTTSYPKKELDFNKVAENMIGLSHAEIERICHESIKFCLLNDIAALTNDIMQLQTIKERNRQKIYEGGN